MLTKGFASLAAAVVVGGGTLLAASGVNAQINLNAALNGIALNGAMNGVTGNAAASQDFDFNNVSVRSVTWTWECLPPLDRTAAVSC